MKGIILHGGAGTRLRPLTFSGPKQLIPVANKPVSQYVLEDLIECGIKEIAIVLGNVYPEKVINYYGDGSKFGVKITYIHQGEPKGIAQAVSLCKEFVADDDFVVYLGDNLFQKGIREYLKEFQNGDYDAYILLKEVEDPRSFGVAKFDSSGKLLDVVEKPKDPPSNYAITGVYFFKPVFFEIAKELKPSWRGEYEITDAIRLFMQKGYKVGYSIVDGWWFDTGKKDDILYVNSIILDEKIQRKIDGEVLNSKIVGRVAIGAGTKVINSTVMGPCIIGRNCLIEESHIGPYTSVGDGSKIIRSSVEYSVILQNAEIEGIERLEESLIGENAKM
ncbi:MAG: glucose-phosphate thymidylyltransferase [Archaeoglobaceae archaeon]|nr:glucose-phosphate thymidylyltransferase [Archaeoglobaceae archaeon]